MGQEAKELADLCEEPPRQPSNNCLTPGVCQVFTELRTEAGGLTLTHALTHLTPLLYSDQMSKLASDAKGSPGTQPFRPVQTDRSRALNDDVNAPAIGTDAASGAASNSTTVCTPVYKVADTYLT